MRRFRRLRPRWWRARRSWIGGGAVMRLRGRESMGLGYPVSIARFRYSKNGHTVSFGFRINSLRADDLQLLRRDTMDQPILLVNGLSSDWLERRCGHGERKGRKARGDAPRAALSMMGMVGLTEACPRGAAFVGWLIRRSPNHYQMYLENITGFQGHSMLRCAVSKGTV